MPDPRIVVDHRIMGGVPCVRGTRIPVATIVGLLADGLSAGQIIDEHPQLAPEDVRCALTFAAQAVRERQVPCVPPDEIPDRRVPEHTVGGDAHRGQP